jgi:beta-glucanase (GH16 family)
VNLVNQSPEAVNQNFNAAGTPGFKNVTTTFPPDLDFHEYRFDWLRDRIIFYFDGTNVANMTEDIPDVSGYIAFNHWSNGNPNWSGGPPKEDAVLTIQYFKAYFNSSNHERILVYNSKCPTFDEHKVCQIPNKQISRGAVPSPENGNIFFSQTQTPGQAFTVGGTRQAATVSWALAFVLSVSSILLAF